MRYATAILCLALGGCGLAPKTPRVYLGVQRVTQADRTFASRAVADDSSAYLNFLVPLGDRCSAQIQPIIPFDGGEPLLRVAFDVDLNLFGP